MLLKPSFSLGKQQLMLIYVDLGLHVGGRFRSILGLHVGGRFRSILEYFFYTLSGSLFM